MQKGTKSPKYAKICKMKVTLDSHDQAKNTFFERIKLCQACKKNMHLHINHSPNDHKEH